MQRRRVGLSKVAAIVIVVIVVVIAAAIGTVGMNYLFPQPHTKLTIADFSPQGDDSIFYVGIDKGYFSNNGIDLSISYVGGGLAALQAVATGKADVAVADPLTQILAYAKGSQTTMIMGLEKDTPDGLAYNTAKVNITSAKSLEGQSILLAPTDSFFILLPAMMAGQGYNWANVKVVNVATSLYATQYLQGAASIVPAFYDSLWVPISLGSQANRIPTKWISLNSLGLNIPGRALCASTALVQNTDLAKRFVQAALQSYQYAAAHPDEATSSLLKANPSVNATIAKIQLQYLLSLDQVPANQLGLIDSGAVQGAITFATKAYNLTSPPSLSNVLNTDFVSH